jgi:hypothetical protein
MTKFAIIPAVAEGAAVEFAARVVAGEQPRRRSTFDTHRDIADLAAWDDAALVVDHLDVEPRHWLAHRAEPDRLVGEVRHDVDRLGLAVAVGDGGSRRLLPEADNFGVEGFARAH